MVEGRYGYGILAHQDLEPNSNYFGSYEKDKWSLHFGSTLPEVLRLNSYNFRIRSSNQNFLYPRISTEKVTRESPQFRRECVFQIRQIQSARLSFCPPKFQHAFRNISFCP